MNSWLVGARPRTLPSAVVPVAIGAGCAVGAGSVTWWRIAVALVVSLALQVGVNYANDYSDGIRGTDDVRVGPVRLVASGLKPPGAVKRAAFTAFGVAAHAGLGEVFVFVFFGLVATIGTTYVGVERITGLSIVMGCAAGCLSCSMLVVNNLRDIPGDTAAGKRTLAVRLGDARTRILYVALLVAAGLLVVGAAAWRPWVLLALLAGALARPAAVAVRNGARGPALIPVLGATGRFQLAFGALATIGLLISS